MDRLQEAVALYHEKAYEKAYTKFLTLANHGDAIAQYYVGLFYRKGIGVDDDQKESFKWFLKSAENGYPESQYLVAKAYIEHPKDAGTPLTEEDFTRINQRIKHNPYYVPFFHAAGVGVKPDIDLSFTWMLRAAKNGHVKAQEELLYYYLTGDLSKRSTHSLKDWIDVEKYRNNPNAYYIEGQILSGCYDYIDEAIKAYTKAYELGFVKAADELGELYENKNGETHDYKKALKWYLLGANTHQLPFSQYRLGHFYRTGHGVEKNRDKAILWFETAANNHHHDPYVYSCIGKLYMEKDEVTEAVQWFKKGAIFSDYDSEVRLKKCYDNGYDVGEIYHHKFNLLDRGKSGDFDAQRLFIKHYIIHQEGYDWAFENWVSFEATEGYPSVQKRYIDNRIRGIELDKALQCYELIAELGNTHAQYMTAIFYKDKDRDFFDPRKSIYWYEKAAKQDIYAQLDMAYHYAHGIYVNIDYLEAYQRYQDVALKMKDIKDLFEINKINDGKIRYNAGNDEAEIKAFSGDVHAQLYLGCLYQYGFEVQTNIKKALIWYSLAFNQGSEEANIQLSIINKDNHEL